MTVSQRATILAAWLELVRVLRHCDRRRRLQAGSLDRELGKLDPSAARDFNCPRRQNWRTVLARDAALSHNVNTIERDAVLQFQGRTYSVLLCETWVQITRVYWPDTRRTSYAVTVHTGTDTNPVYDDKARLVFKRGYTRNGDFQRQAGDWPGAHATHDVPPMIPGGTLRPTCHCQDL